MNKNILVLLLSFLIVSGCQNDAKNFSGDYSYKTSGSIQISSSKKNEITYKLSDKIGQMNVIDLKSSGKDSVLLIMNDMGGEVITLRGKVSDDSIYINPYSRSINVPTDTTYVTAKIIVTGKGIRYNNHILLNEIYSGSLSNNISIYGNPILTVATRN